MTRPRRRLLYMLMAGLLTLQPAAALGCETPRNPGLSAADMGRMEGFLRSRSQGLAEALVAESADDRALVSSLFSPGERPVGSLPEGDYRCRTIKLGGLLPLTAYGFFQCHIADGRIEKVTGSQRFTGDLYPAGDAVFYRGALHYGDENPIAYGQDASRDQVGCIYAVPGAKGSRYRLELPAPHFESSHDVIELVPSK